MWPDESVRQAREPSEEFVAPVNSDANGDGIVNVADLVYLQKYLLSTEN